MVRAALALFLSLASLFGSAQINVEAVAENARQALSRDDNVTALAWLNLVLQARPTYARAYYYRAYAHFNLSDYPAAVADCDSSIQLNPFLVEVYRFRGLCRLHTSDWRGAASDYARVLTEKPTDESALFNSAICLQRLGRSDSAALRVTSLLRRNPNFRRGWLFKAQLALERSDTLSALALMDTALDIQPADPQTWLFKGQYAMLHDRYATADSCLSLALHYDNRRAACYALRGECRRRLGLTAAAEADEQRARQLQREGQAEQRPADSSAEPLKAPLPSDLGLKAPTGLPTRRPK